ncbi:amino acid ABC transporter permease [Bdellovibrio bacteriovorus]|uniref:Putative glutamine transport system permease protein GlnP n=1 Tax=Bdellovibrio bacteriovorus str. Tiberius TaxID=1069642 RepID=K7YL72_BDEBC|nr:amino acid ABC transporter permease [Bdellovibrio bacteriovorus]AFY00491.1 polar amino acid transport system permease protein [Bdellovibrio bacteriovorus str. Tiberius]
MFSWFRTDIIIEYWPLFMQGLVTTLQLTLIGIFFGTVLGLFLGLGKIARIERGPWRWPVQLFVRLPSQIYIGFFRGTPLFVQILLIHFALVPLLIHPEDGLLISGDMALYLKREYGALISGALALSLNSAAYIAEIFRAGIQSIDRGQFEAARSLGLGYFHTMKSVIIPQAFRRMLPPLGNEAITLLKDSSLVSAIGLAELAYAARTAAGAYARYWEPYLFISLIYLIITLGMSFVVHRLEKRYQST